MKAITTILILLNVLMFGAEVALTMQFISLNNDVADGMFYLYGATPACITMERVCEDVTPMTLISSMFLHGGLMHILFNMIMLMALGGTIEERLGKGKFLAVYVAGGLAGGLAQVMWDPSSIIPTVGASGAISGLMGLILILAPKAKMAVPVGFFFMRIQARFFLPGWLIIYNIIPMLGIAIPFIVSPGSTAYMAHIGGFVFGLIIGIILVKTGGKQETAPAYDQQPI